MDQFLVQLERSNIQCSLLTCNLGEAQTASLISADSGLKARILIGSITQTDTCTNTCNSKSDLRKIRKSKLWDVFILVSLLPKLYRISHVILYGPYFKLWVPRCFLDFRMVDRFSFDMYLYPGHGLRNIFKGSFHFNEIFVGLNLTSNCKWKLFKSVRTAVLPPPILYATYIMAVEVFVLKWVVSLIKVEILYYIDLNSCVPFFTIIDVSFFVF